MFRSRRLNNRIKTTLFHRNLQFLASCLSCLFILHRNDTFEKCQVHSVYRGPESLSVLGPKICDLVPVELKQSENIYMLYIYIYNIYIYIYDIYDIYDIYIYIFVEFCFNSDEM